ncbi:MAG: FAD-binding protein [Caulobacteraceae bacterium]
MRPTTLEDLAGIVAEAAAAGRKLEIAGGGSKGEVGAPRAAERLDMTGFNGVIDYDPAELVLTVGAGTPLAEIETLIASKSQMLAFEPHGAPGSTIGGIVAAGVSGSRRVSRGAVRDHLLGFKAVSGRGEAFVGGAKVVKNVTGYDLPKLACGSWGRLLALAEVTLKVLPRPPEQLTLFAEGLDPADAVALMSRALGSQADVAAAACADGVTALRLEGFGPSVKARRALLEAMMSLRAVSEGDARVFWSALTTPLPQAPVLWRLSLPASRAADVVQAELGPWMMDWGVRRSGWHRTMQAPCAPPRPRPAATPCWSARRKPCAARFRPCSRSPPQSLPWRPASAAPSTQPACSRRGVSMQTRFSPELLADPDMASSEAVIRSACTAASAPPPAPPTSARDELDSPRGRIYLMKEMLEEAKAPTPEVVKHIDRCLSCLSCMTTCPSGVNYMHLVDHARAYIEDHYRRPLGERLLRWLLAKVLPHPKRFRLALALARLARPVRPLFGKGPLGAMLALAPDRAAKPALTPPVAVSAPKGRVVMLQGCAEPVLKPQYQAAAIRLLARAGYQVVQAAGEGCCGALVHHMGRKAEALADARRNVDAWTAEIEGPEKEGGGIDAILVTASGCGTTLKDYGFMLRDDPAYADRRRGCPPWPRMSASSWRRSTCRLWPPRPACAVAYHAACSLQHGQQITEAPRTCCGAPASRC